MCIKTYPMWDDMYAFGIVLSGLGQIRPYDDDRVSYVRMTLE